jgi:hypothetical protein
MKNFFETNIPAWYKLSFSGSSIFLEVHRMAFDFIIGNKWGNAPRLAGSKSKTS